MNNPSLEATDSGGFVHHIDSGAYYEFPPIQVPQFVERTDLLERVEASFANTTRNASHPKIVVLLGMGGQGKTQLALNYCRVLERLGKYEVAEEVFRRALAGGALGKEHPETLMSVSNLGVVPGSQCKYEVAEEMYRRALAGREKVLEGEHPNTLASVSNLAWALERLGKYKTAAQPK